jgi:hypothetical protein
MAPAAVQFHARRVREEVWSSSADLLPPSAGCLRDTNERVTALSPKFLYVLRENAN